MTSSDAQGEETYHHDSAVKTMRRRIEAAEVAEENRRVAEETAIEAKKAATRAAENAARLAEFARNAENDSRWAAAVAEQRVIEAEAAVKMIEELDSCRSQPGTPKTKRKQITPEENSPAVKHPRLVPGTARDQNDVIEKALALQKNTISGKTLR